MLTATSQDENNFIFINWTEDDVVVHDKPDYVFTVTENRILTANFQNVTSVSTLEGSHFLSVFPQPATSFLNIASACTIQKVHLLDLSGRMYYSESVNDTQHALPLTGMSDGLYILYVISERGLIAKKIQIIQ
jgi:hypothetical protein